jgi:hypothetical protein
MENAALVAWLVTAGGGLIMVAIWIARGGLRQAHDPSQVAGARSGPIDEGAEPERDSGLPLWQVFTHAAMAVTGLIIFLLLITQPDEAPSGYESAPWFALIALAFVAALGVTMVRRWHADRQRLGEARRDPGAPPEQHIPIAVVGLHGLAALVTIVLVALVAIGV